MEFDLMSMTSASTCPSSPSIYSSSKKSKQPKPVEIPMMTR